MITQYPNNILSKKSRAVNPVTRADAATLQAMADIMKKTDGLGLAAPQIGINRRMIVARTPEGTVKMINPVIKRRAGESIMYEGCLSIPGVTVAVKRSRMITVSGLNEHGEHIMMEAVGLISHVFQHEIDHLNGRLIIDYLPAQEKMKLHAYVMEKRRRQ